MQRFRKEPAEIKRKKETSKFYLKEHLLNENELKYVWKIVYINITYPDNM